MSCRRLVAALLQLLLLAAVSAAEEEVASTETPPAPKPFGVGRGPAHIGGRDTDEEGTRVALRIYGQLLQYRRLLQLQTLEQQQYYTRWGEEAVYLS